MRDRDLDNLLASGSPHQVDARLLDSISNTITSSLHPVKPMPPQWVLTLGLIAICWAVAVAGAAKLGMYGLEKLNGLENASMFAFLGLFTWIAATLSAAEMTPGSPRRISPAWLLTLGSVSLAALCALLFHDYGTDHFVARGFACLKAGLLHAIPTGLASWLLLRRGFAVSPVSAGLATGTLASLAGVTMLELHCPNPEVLHMMFWHTAVIPVSGLAGALLGWFGRKR